MNWVAATVFRFGNWFRERIAQNHIDESQAGAKRSIEDYDNMMLEMNSPTPSIRSMYVAQYKEDASGAISLVLYYPAAKSGRLHARRPKGVHRAVTT